MAVKIRRVHPKDWELCKGQFLKIEEIFESNLREDEGTIKAFFDDTDAIVLSAESDGGVVGCSYSAPLESDLFLKTPGPTEKYKTLSDFLKRDANFGKHNIVYETSFAVLPEYQGEKIGTELDKELARIARNRGYEFITAHNEPDASIHIAESLGWKKIEKCENWYGTGEDYWYMMLKL